MDTYSEPGEAPNWQLAKGYAESKGASQGVGPEIRERALQGRQQVVGGAYAKPSGVDKGGGGGDGVEG